MNHSHTPRYFHHYIYPGVSLFTLLQHMEYEMEKKQSHAREELLKLPHKSGKLPKMGRLIVPPPGFFNSKAHTIQSIIIPKSKADRSSFFSLLLFVHEMSFLFFSHGREKRPRKGGFFICNAHLLLRNFPRVKRFRERRPSSQNKK